MFILWKILYCETLEVQGVWGDICKLEIFKGLLRNHSLVTDT